MASIAATLYTLTIAVDSGLLALIWLVQLAVYPSFLHARPDRFNVWHEQYTRRMGFVAGPLMILQLGLAVYWLFALKSASSIFYLVAVLATWAATFSLSVPLHKRIRAIGFDARTLQSLITTNWIRTSLWTLVAIRHFLPL